MALSKTIMALKIKNVMVQRILLLNLTMFNLLKKLCPVCIKTFVLWKKWLSSIGHCLHCKALSFWDNFIIF
ncbi:hypothetical protein ACHAXS_009747 [Conticribra weissflogii]